LSGSHNAQEHGMFFLDFFRDPYLRQIELTGAAAVGRFHAKQANIEQTREHALGKLKRLAVEQAITIERLNHPSFCNGPRLDDPAFKRKVQDTAAALLFESHLHLSVGG
jgi:hypothetical protein